MTLWQTCDPQIEELHKAEMEFYPKRKKCKSYAGRIKWSEALSLIRKVRKQFALPPIKLYRAGPNNTKNQAWVDFFTYDDGEIARTCITIDTRHEPVTASTVLHELAHVIADVYFDYAEPHGREFVGVVSWLYDHYQVIPADAFGVVLRRHGIKRRPLRFCSPEALRK